MVGHKLTQVLSKDLDVWGTSTTDADYIAGFTGVPSDRIIPHFNALESKDLDAAFTIVKPDVVINAIGLVKQNDKILQDDLADQINVRLPGRLAHKSEIAGARLIHLSTDCVFSGMRGQYSESDPPDATDTYGMTKSKGEVALGDALIIRTSYIGRELRHFYGLLEWLRKQPPGEVPGYRNATWSGFPTVIFARILQEIVTQAPQLQGTYHLASVPLSKFELLQGITNAVQGPWTITPVELPIIDLSLNGAKFIRDTQITVPSWSEMYAELALDSQLHDERGIGH